MISNKRKAQLLATARTIEHLVKNDLITGTSLDIDQEQDERVTVNFSTYLNRFAETYVRKYKRIYGAISAQNELPYHSEDFRPM